MDNLERLFQIQREQQGLWHDADKLTDSERAAQFDELLLGLHEEVGELARECRRRPHVVRQERGHKGNAAEEAVDVLKYLLAICQLLDVTPQQLVNRFEAKSLAVRQKVMQYRVELEGRRVFVTDLDGCVADLSPFMAATGGQYGGEHVGKLSTEDLKAAWYEGGGFLTLPLIEGALNCIREARAQGCLIAIITARPVWEHARTRPDTVAWLHDYGVPYDILLFNKDKWDALYQSVLPAKVVAFVEDRSKHVDELVSHHVKPVFLVDQPWNQEVAEHPDVTRVHGWDEIQAALAASGWGR